MAGEEREKISFPLYFMSIAYRNECVTEVGSSADCRLLVPNGSLTLAAFTAELTFRDNLRKAKLEGFLWVQTPPLIHH